MRDKIIARGNKGIVFIIFTVILCGIAVLGVFGILAYGGLKGNRFVYLDTDTYRFMNLLSWIFLGIDLTVCAAGWLFKYEADDRIKSMAQWEEDFQDKLKKELDIGIFLFDIFMMLTFLFIGIRFFIANDNRVVLPLWMAALLGAAIVVLGFFRLQLKLLCREMENHRGDQQRGERVGGPRTILYRCGYRTYKITGRILLASMVLIMVITRFSSPLAIVIFLGMGVLRITMEGIFLYERKTMHKKIK